MLHEDKLKHWLLAIHTHAEICAGMLPYWNLPGVASQVHHQLSNNKERTSDLMQMRKQ